MAQGGKTEAAIETGGHRSVALLLAVLLTFGSILTSRLIKDDEQEAIWRNTEHTASMLSSLLKEQVESTAEKLALVHAIHGGDQQLLAAIESDNTAVLDQRAATIKRSSQGLVDGIFFYAPDGRMQFSSHPGEGSRPPQVFWRVKETAKPAFGLEFGEEDYLHVHFASTISGASGGSAILDISASLNDKLDGINRLLRLEMEQHAATGNPGDTSFGIFRLRPGIDAEFRPLVTTGSFPRGDLPYLRNLIVSEIPRGETEGYQYRVVPMPDVTGTTVAAAVLALDVTTATAAGHSRANKFLILMLLGSAVAVLLFVVLLERNARRNRENTEQLAAAVATAEAATRAKSYFLANMSHEIRTPMNSVLGMAYLLSGTELDAKQRDYAENIHASGQHLLRLIDRILDLSKIEAGKLELEASDFNLHDLAVTVASVVTEKARAKGLQFIFDVAPHIDYVLRGDPLRISQILINLVGNAVKFTDDGAVTMRIRVPEEDATRARLVFEVIDTGPGMSAAVQARVFAPFEQADVTTTRKYGGTGLGLTICKQLAELMEGTLEVSSQPGTGCTFRFSVQFPKGTGAAANIPSAAALEAPNTAHYRQVLAGRRILLAEDHPLNQRVATALLQGVGIIPCVANNGEEALALLASECFDCVLMDIQMPVLDGIATTRAIRARPGLAGLFVIAMTANASSEDRACYLAAGMDDVLTKPVVPEQLYSMLSNMLGIADLAPVPMKREAIESESGTEPVLDLRVIERAALGRPAALVGYLELFLSTARTDLAGIQEALGRQDTAASASIAHRLKGTARAIGALPFADTCLALEQLKQPDDLVPALSALVSMESDFATLSDEITGAIRRLRASPAAS